MFLSIIFDYYSACSCSEGLTLLVSPENKPLDTEMIESEKTNLQDTFTADGGLLLILLLFNSYHSDSFKVYFLSSVSVRFTSSA